MLRKSVLAITVALAACASPEADLKKASGICTAGGVTEGTPAFRACVADEVATLESNRQQVGQALAMGMQSYGDNMARQPAYRAPVSCTSNRVGTYTYTNCY